MYEYLDKFVSELEALYQDGCLLSENAAIRTKFSLSCIICDAPARAFVKQIKGHSGYHGCDKCLQRGVWNRKMTFPLTNANRRTDVSFDEMRDDHHHIGPSPFGHLPIGMVSQFPTDYMHLVYLGVMKRVLWLWMKGPLINACRIGAGTIRSISESLAALKCYLPREFNRKGRPLNEI